VQQRDPASLDGGAELRFTMLQTIQEFAASQLELSGEAQAVRDAHAAFFLNLATEAKSALSGPTALAWLKRLDADHANLRAALTWLRQSGQVAQTMLLAAALWRFWLLRGYIGEGRSQLEAVLAIESADGDAAIRAEVLDAAGVFAEMQGDYARADSLHQQSLELARQHDDQVGMARALGNLGVVAFERGEADEAQSLLRQSLELAEVEENQELTATALNDLGRVAYHRGDLQQAEELYQRSLDLRRQTGSDSEVARALNNLGYVAFDRGDFSRAQRLFEESLRLSRAAGDTWVTAAPLNALALAVRREGDLPRAIALNEESLALFREAGDTKNAAVALLNLAGATRESGDHAQAIAYFQEALQGFRAVDDRVGIVEALSWIASILIVVERNADAARLLGAAAHLASGQDGVAELIDSEPFASDKASAKAALGDDPFAAAWREGEALSLDEAVTVATAISLPEQPGP
jgi:tetratricopeptide (TPR) repeat protein